MNESVDCAPSEVGTSRVQDLKPNELSMVIQDHQGINPVINISQLKQSLKFRAKRYKQALYLGEMLAERRHGKGVIIYNDERVYEGEWQADQKYGFGVERLSSNAIYSGNYVNGKPHGKGVYKWPNGQTYNGDWLQGLKHGSAVWRGANGDEYTGQWRNGKVEGLGIFISAKGDKYEGQFQDCLKHGQGIERFANGDVYKGGYENGKASGYGEYFWANGSFYKGSFSNGLRHGKGVWKRGPGNSDRYEGEYLNDQKWGHGTFTWTSGNVYRGGYEADLRNGYGEMYWTDGSNYKGEWKAGVQDGLGAILVPTVGHKKGIFVNNVLVELHEQVGGPPSNPQDTEMSSVSRVSTSTSSKRRAFFSGQFGKSQRQTNSRGKASSIRDQAGQKPQIGEQVVRTQNHSFDTREAYRISRYFPNSKGFKNSLDVNQSYSVNRHMKPPLGRLSQNSRAETINPKQPLLSRPVPSDSKGRQRLLHSSFYIHRIMKKGELTPSEQ